MVMATGDCQCQCQCLGMCLGQLTGSSHRSGVSGIKIDRALLELPDTDHDTDTDSWPVNTPTRGMPPPRIAHARGPSLFSLLLSSALRLPRASLAPYAYLSDIRTPDASPASRVSFPPL